jgi:AmiR/NasT family two-component response regulator
LTTEIRERRLAPTALELENSQLRTALTSRIVIEQAKGILSERFDLKLDEAFELLRRSARSSRCRIHELATDVTARRETPPEIERLLGEFCETKRSA